MTASRTRVLLGGGLAIALMAASAWWLNHIAATAQCDADTASVMPPPRVTPPAMLCGAFRQLASLARAARRAADSAAHRFGGLAGFRTAAENDQ